LSPADLALICASHGATPAHVERAADLLARGGFGEQDLLCGAHPPLDGASAERLREEGTGPTSIHNNCSGKHAGMLLVCRVKGLATGGYIDPGHPLQQEILETMAHFCGLPADAIGVGVDGCSAPTFHLPLAAAARAYAALADPRAAALPEHLHRPVTEVVRAMTGEPLMVAGPGRFTTRLMEVTGGRILGKEGAEGFYGAAVRGPVALGVAVKIGDGGERCRDGVVLDVLRQLGALSGAEFAELAAYHRPPVKSWRGTVVGEIVPEVDLEAAL
jgi:L-asparaginase II